MSILLLRYHERNRRIWNIGKIMYIKLHMGQSKMDQNGPSKIRGRQPLKTVFHKLYLVHSYIQTLCHIYLLGRTLTFSLGLDMHLNVAQHFKVLNNAVNGFSSNLDTHIKISLLWSLNEATHLQCSFFLLPLSFQIPARLIWRLDFKSKFIYGWYLYFLSCSKQIQQWYVVNYYFQIIYKALSRSWRCNLWFGT